MDFLSRVWDRSTAENGKKPDCCSCMAVFGFALAALVLQDVERKCRPEA